MLRTLFRVSVVASLAAFAIAYASTAEAQQRGFRAGLRSPILQRLSIVGNEKVQVELGLSEQQKTDLQKLGEDVRTSLRELFTGGQNLSEAQEAERRTKVEEKARAVQQKLNIILLPHQGERLKQVYWQVAGPDSVFDEEVAKALVISEDQQKTLDTIRDETGQQMREVFSNAALQGDANREARRTKLAEVRKASHEKIVAVLTEDQTKKLEELQGKKFEIPEELRDGFFGRGRRQ